MGDAEGKDRNNADTTTKYAEAIIIRDVPANVVKSDVLKLGHHGSETSSTHRLIEKVDPTVFVITSGRHAYGGTFLPDSSTVMRICRGRPTALVARTDDADAGEHRTGANDADGDDVVITTNGTDLAVTPFSHGHAVAPHTCHEFGGS